MLSNFNAKRFKPAEINAVLNDFISLVHWLSTCLHLGGTKYVVMQGEAGTVIRGKKWMFMGGENDDTRSFWSSVEAMEAEKIYKLLFFSSAGLSFIHWEFCSHELVEHHPQKAHVSTKSLKRISDQLAARLILIGEKKILGFLLILVS